jgi:hypothetical protein
MDSAPKPASEVPTDVSLEFAKYLWEEYKYRHDLIWRLLFRVTAVAALLSIVPFTISDSVRENAGFAVNLVPALALVLILASWRLLVFEWKLFAPIVTDYREAQKRARQGLQLDADGQPTGPVPKKPEVPGQRDIFKLIVYVYPGILFGLAACVSLIVWVN